jgi:CBS-domain-containing membrane protein
LIDREEELRMATKKAGDIMIPLQEYPHIPYWFTLRQAVAELEKSALQVEGRMSLPRALLVFDEKYDLVGILRRRDILRGLEPKFLRTMSISHRKSLFDVEIDPKLADLSAGQVGDAMREQSEHPVSEVMQPIVSTVSVDDHLAAVIYKMLSRDLYLIPVLKEQEVVGVIRSVEVFHEVASLLL